MNYQTISETILERLKTTTNKAFNVSGCTIKLEKHSIIKILYYDDKTLAELYIDKLKIFSRVDISRISNYAFLEIIFKEGTVKFSRGNVFSN